MTEKVKTTIKNLEENGYQAEYFQTAKEAKEYLLKEIPMGQSVGFGGSMTLQEVGIYDSLKERGSQVFWHWHPEEGGDRISTMKKAMITDVYLSGINAVTEDGKMVNIDGTGNRLSGLLFGHDHLYMVAGVNKITKNYEDAMIRVKNVATPKNAARFQLNTPCATLGKCMACTSPDRICNVTLVMEKQHGGIPTTVILIGEKLGY